MLLRQYIGDRQGLMRITKIKIVNPLQFCGAGVVIFSPELHFRVSKALGLFGQGGHETDALESR